MPPQHDPGPPPWPGGGPPPYAGPPRKKHRVRKVVLLCLAGFVGFIVLISVVVGLTSGPSAKKAASPPASSAPADPTSAAPSTPDNLTGPVGTTFTFIGTDQNGNDLSYDVTATRILDPAKGADEFSTPDSGNRFVGVKFKITGDSGYSSDDANNDAVIQGSDGQIYNADFSSIAAGTNFNGGDFGVTAGHTQTGWVTFQVPKGVSVASVQWHPDSGMSDTQPATWTRG